MPLSLITSEILEQSNYPLQLVTFHSCDVCNLPTQRRPYYTRTIRNRIPQGQTLSSWSETFPLSLLSSSSPFVLLSCRDSSTGIPLLGGWSERIYTIIRVSMVILLSLSQCLA